MPEPLTPIERRIYQFLIDHLKEETFQPSVREIGRKFGIRSTKTVAEHLESLERKGCIARMPARSRGVRILGVNLSPQTYTIRAYNGAGAPDPDVSPTHDDIALELDRALAGSPDAFLLRLDGWSDAGSECPGLLAGDYLVVEPTETPGDGEWVAVQEAERICVRRWRAAVPGEASTGSNGPGTVAVLGRVRAVVRRFGAA
jgi:repressor LexA